MTSTDARLIAAGLAAANIPRRFLGRTFENTEPYPESTTEPVRAWIDTVIAGDVVLSSSHATTGVGMLFEGQPGVGKSLLSTMILQELLAKAPRKTWDPEKRRSIYDPVRFITYPDLLHLVKAGWNDDDIQDKVNRMFGMSSTDADNVRLLVIDDLGKEHRTNTNWAEDTFDHLLRQRFDRALPTIVTTNVPLKSWGTVYGAPMASFASEAFWPIKVTSTVGDRRIGMNDGLLDAGR